MKPTIHSKSCRLWWETPADRAVRTAQWKTAERNSIPEHQFLPGLTPPLNTLKVTTESKSRTGIFQIEIRKKNSTNELTLDSQSQHRTGTLWKTTVILHKPPQNSAWEKQKGNKAVRLQYESRVGYCWITVKLKWRQDMKDSINQIITAMEASSTEWITSQEWKRK